MPCAKLTPNEREVLGNMAEGEWLRPMDVGGHDSSHHSKTLKRLCDKGLVERAPRNTLRNVMAECTTALNIVTGKIEEIAPGRVASWCYRITSAGLAAKSR